MQDIIGSRSCLLQNLRCGVQGEHDQALGARRKRCVQLLISQGLDIPIFVERVALPAQDSAKPSKHQVLQRLQARPQERGRAAPDACNKRQVQSCCQKSVLHAFINRDQVHSDWFCIAARKKMSCTEVRYYSTAQAPAYVQQCDSLLGAPALVETGIGQHEQGKATKACVMCTGLILPVSWIACRRPLK